MPRSSESIAALAAALAKAQCELTNPEKSLVGTIKAQGGAGGPAANGWGARSARSGEGAERVFRYASLASGLDIVRKTLGQHQIATVQTTAIDQSAGTVNLTTVLAHASGEWISSDWPVCAIADSKEPHRMGAALTYARRYALFTLVGIAGEDDLDAPDLITPTRQYPDEADTLRRGGSGNAGNGNGYKHHPQGQRLSKGRIPAGPQPSLLPEQSGSECQRLMAELAAIDTPEAAAVWAKQILPVKNRLTAADAHLVEDAFQAKLQNLVEPDAAPIAADASAIAPNANPTEARSSSTAALEPPTPAEGAPASIDKAALAFPEPRRIRDKEHLKFVAQHPCLVCERRPCDAHHLRFAQSRALSRKVSDEFTVPLCRGHHRELHRQGDEAAWWSNAGIDPLAHARTLWLTTHPLRGSPGQMAMEIAANDNARRPRRGSGSKHPGKHRPHDETKPIAAVAVVSRP